MTLEQGGFDPYNNQDAQANDILEGNIPPKTDEEVQEIRRAIDAHRQGDEGRKAA